MNDDTQLESGLATALREYADDVHPDLDTLVRSSRLAGGRIRLRRRLGGSVAAAAAVASIVGVATVGSQFGHPNASTAPDFAGQPTIGPTHAAHPKTCAKGLPDLRGLPAVTQFKRSVNAGGPAPDLRKVSEKIRHQPGGPAVCTLRPLAKLKTMPGDSAPPAVFHGQDVTIHLAGWKQVGPVGDDKQSLEGPHGAVADIVWRPASDYRAWTSSSDKGNNSSVWTSTVHAGVFVSIQGGSGTTDADIQALGKSLTWN